MGLIKELLLIVILLACPVVTGNLCDRMLVWKTGERTLSGAFISGCMVYLVVFGALSEVGRNRGWEFAEVQKFLLISGLFLLFFSAIVSAFSRNFRSDMKQRVAVLLETGVRERAVWAVMYAIVAAVYLFCPFYISETFSVPEQVLSLVRTGDIHAANENLAVFYACLCKWFALPAGDVLFDVVPYIVLVLSFCVISELGKALMGENRRARLIFPVCYTLLILFGNEAHMNPPYGLLHFPYEGMTLVSNVLIPYMFVLLLKKKSIPGAAVLILTALLMEPLRKGSVVLAAQWGLFVVCALFFFLYERRKKR